MNKCPHCSVELEKGALLDFSYGVVMNQRWAQADTPDEKQKVVLSGIESDYKNLRRVDAFRCPRCNHLYLFAQNTIVVENIKKQNSKFLLGLLGVLVIFFAVMFLVWGIFNV